MLSMISKAEFKFSYTVYETSNELNHLDHELLNEARAVTQFAYAPYSNFKVGAVARLINGETVRGTNQENASYPAGLCAERVLLSSASALFPGVAIETMAISYDNVTGSSDKPASPCGICRQTLTEFQQRTEHPIRIILGGQQGEVQVIENAEQLLPFCFGSNDLN